MKAYTSTKSYSGGVRNGNIKGVFNRLYLEIEQCSQRRSIELARALQ